MWISYRLLKRTISNHPNNKNVYSLKTLLYLHNL